MRCEFPGCEADPVGHGVRCALHENVMISSSYLEAEEEYQE